MLEIILNILKMRGLTNEEFINKAKEIWGEFYDYSPTNYTSGRKPIDIKCPIHGEFEIKKAQDHLQKSYCPKCGKEDRAESMKKFNKTKILTTEEFIEKAKAKHGNKYNYFPTEYTCATEKVNIVCSKHGLFSQVASDHLRGSGCVQCGKNSININRRFTQEQFIDRVNDIEGITFEKTKYKNKRERVVVTCEIHGDYKTTPDSLLKGSSCKRCAGLQNNGTWSFSDWEKAGNESNALEGFKVYIIRCYNINENFIKIGKTYNSIKKRFHGFPYEHQIIDTVTGSARFISELEVALHKKNKRFKYIPKKQFGGMNECFNIDCSITV